MGRTKDVFLCYRDSKELFNAMKTSQINFSEAKNKQNEFLNKLNQVKIGKTTTKQKEVIDNLESFYKSREEVINFLTIMFKCYLMQITRLTKTRLREKYLKY